MAKRRGGEEMTRSRLWTLRALMLALWVGCVILIFALGGCYRVQVPEDPGWQLWPRTTANDCLTPVCQSQYDAEWELDHAEGLQE